MERMGMKSIYGLNEPVAAARVRDIIKRDMAFLMPGDFSDPSGVSQMRELRGSAKETPQPLPFPRQIGRCAIDLRVANP